MFFYPVKIENGDFRTKQNMNPWLFNGPVYKEVPYIMIEVFLVLTDYIYVIWKGFVLTVDHGSLLERV